MFGLDNDMEMPQPPDEPKSEATFAASGGSVAREQMHCPKCDWPGVYIRTRYFETMTADVWMCNNSKCESYRLYWHDDKPLNAKAHPQPAK